MGSAKKVRNKPARRWAIIILVLSAVLISVGLLAAYVSNMEKDSAIHFISKEERLKQAKRNTAAIREYMNKLELANMSNVAVRDMTIMICDIDDPTLRLQKDDDGMYLLDTGKDYLVVIDMPFSEGHGRDPYLMASTFTDTTAGDLGGIITATVINGDSGKCYDTGIWFAAKDYSDVPICICRRHSDNIFAISPFVYGKSYFCFTICLTTDLSDGSPAVEYRDDINGHDFQASVYSLSFSMKEMSETEAQNGPFEVVQV